ncbi:MAG: DUF6607 family protein [Planctomycetota bacterium]
MMNAIPYRPILTLASAAMVLAALFGLLGCTSAQTVATSGDPESSCSDCSGCATLSAKEKFEQDRRAILAMAGEYRVTFEFEETMAVREGYELKEPYTTGAHEMVVVAEDTGTRIALQHLLVVGHGGQTHVIKHWRQDWEYQVTEGYSFQGDNEWEPATIEAGQAPGVWMQSVYQVDDSPRYWGAGQWVHRDGVSTWTGSLTNRPLPRREYTKRSDYQILGAVNTHVVSEGGWMHYQSNYKLDTQNAEQPVIALESGTNTYRKTEDFDFSAAEEYWENTHAYWAVVREAWSEVYAERETVKLRKTWRGDPMFSHIFDLADEYWGEEDPAEARAKIDAVISEFMKPDAVALP